MTIEKLMEPRYEVIADYPDSDLPVGTIANASYKQPYYKDLNSDPEEVWYSDFIETDKGSASYCFKTFEKYPHLFRSLKWWERREVEQMPEYVKLIADKHSKFYQVIAKVELWNLREFKYPTVSVLGGYWFEMEEIEPATESDYLFFKNAQDVINQGAADERSVATTPQSETNNPAQ